MSQAKRDKKPTNGCTIETSRYLLYQTREALSQTVGIKAIKNQNGCGEKNLPQREVYANEAQKQTLLQVKCVTYNKNKLNNKENR